jgi:hypothetical protein
LNKCLGTKLEYVFINIDIINVNVGAIKI